ncbi:phytochromobilin:ferredoxin oxidoreductase, chloroplastic isoform X5 [Abrus precatorius]|uniref:Phytochromobilin:ferredoxin oxidoreductase, chloroplastic isoform X5 n=1 Tax=Abrus precatorius TaxID=3816 RepID=A0A8B8JJB9_ABRPR|nr:phytochromobilin:ferredoxin oxidoreductase, chloroplastic isoform X5 [Abrus precatorius]
MGFGLGGSASSSSYCLQRTLPPSLTRIAIGSTSTRNCRRKTCILNFSVSYHKFVDFALDETTRHIHLVPSPLQDKFNFMNSKDGKGGLSMRSFEAGKIRLLRSLIIETETMFWILLSLQKQNMMSPYFVLIFSPPLKQTLLCYFMQLFPWGGKLTSESINFFSPIVIWTKFTSSPQKYDILYAAFRDYYKVWLELIGKADKETDESLIFHNLEAQHRYLTWRAEKDPGKGLLKKLIGDTLAKDLLRSFLFNGVDELGSKTFNDYFPHYCCEEGVINTKGNIMKSFENRPWDARGEFLGPASENTML